MPHDALDVNAMSVKPGGKQHVMRDGFWNGKVQKMNFSLGVPKGLQLALEERGINMKGLGASEMRAILLQHDHFKNEKSKIERYLEGNGDTIYLFSKYHCELNPIERVWTQSKRYTKAYFNNSILSQRKNITPAIGKCFIREYPKLLFQSKTVHVYLLRRCSWRIRFGKAG